jgi:indole-3-glycerol phosphate synthase
MDASDSVAPAVESILRTARAREGGKKRLTIEAQSFPEAVSGAENEGRVPVIAEVKPTSPTTENVREDDPVELAREMVAGGATAISVLTEPDHFGGSPEILERVRESVDVPVLRKDFVLREEQLDTVESDLILLIARFVDDLEGLVNAATERGFQPLVEVHTPEELEEAVAAGAEIVGINNRDLARLEVDLGTFERVAAEAPEDVLLIAESGIGSKEDVRRMCKAGADALLIGTAIMDGDVRENTEEFTTV